MSPSVRTRESRGRMRSRSMLAASTMANSDRHDPLSFALLPPPDETPMEKQARLQQEKQAKQRSDEIDKLLKQSDATTLSPHLLQSLPGSQGDSAKKGRVYKMVLLGQAGAGKTTILKQMRLLYDPQAHERERRGWTKIVLLNLTASTRVLLQTLSRYHEERCERKSTELARSEFRSWPGVEENSGAEQASSRGTTVLEVGPKNEINTSGMPWVAHLPKLLELERELRNELGAFPEEAILTEPIGGAASVAASSEDEWQQRGSAVMRRSKSSDKSPLLLRPGWQERLFTYARRSFSLNVSSTIGASDRGMDSQVGPTTDDEEGNREMLTFLRTIQAEVLALWNDDVRTRALRKRGLFLDSQSDAATSYFLDNYARLTSRAYYPSDDDILHSRVRTVGVTESLFRADRTLIYRIFDVGGSRSQRTAWAPFLDDVESIIFLAPLSAFDQPLTEEPGTNRLADTFALFNQIVSNPLLAHASMILFLNKIDLLEKKLRQGVKLARYWPEYDGDNDFEAVWRWFRAKFRDSLRRAEHEAGLAKRRLYVHTTVATSTKQIKAILMSVKDSILRENLRVTGLVA